MLGEAEGAPGAFAALEQAFDAFEGATEGFHLADTSAQAVHQGALGRSGGAEVPRDLAGGLAEVAQAPTNAAMLKELL